MFIIIPESMESAMQKDLDKMRDSLPPSEHALFEKERPLIRQQIIDFFAENGCYPIIGGIEKVNQESQDNCDICGDYHDKDSVPLSCETGDGE